MSFILPAVSLSVLLPMPVALSTPPPTLLKGVTGRRRANRQEHLLAWEWAGWHCVASCVATTMRAVFVRRRARSER